MCCCLCILISSHIDFRKEVDLFEVKEGQNILLLLLNLFEEGAGLRGLRGSRSYEHLWQRNWSMKSRHFNGQAEGTAFRKILKFF